MTDLDKFVALYESFGIHCVVNKTDEGFFIELIELDAFCGSLPQQTASDKFEGYNGFYSEIRFDTRGNFLKQGFWE